jgi:ubiquinone/menaquinone biosynthesis C-methylase UbiE
MAEHSICPSWLSFSLVNSIRNIFQNPRKMLKDYITPGSIIADIGCGPGYFSIPMAYMTGPNGKVISVDIQDKMIIKLRKRIQNYNLEARVNIVKCKSNDLYMSERVDFALTFWMVHEVKDKSLFFKQISQILKDRGRYLLVEPRIHVSGKEYSETVRKAESNGLQLENNAKFFFSRASLFSKRI